MAGGEPASQSPFLRVRCERCQAVTTHNKAGCVPCASRAGHRVQGALWLAVGLVACGAGLFFTLVCAADGRSRATLVPLTLALVGWALGLDLAIGGARALYDGHTPRLPIPILFFGRWGR